MSKSSTELLGNYITEYSVKNKNGADIPVYSVSNDKGFCRDYFSKDVSSKDKTSYKIVPRGCFAYNPSRINVGSIAWQDKEDAVIVSPLYVVFSTEGLNNDFLMYYLKSNALMSYIKIYSAGAVRNNLRFKTLSSFPVKVPSLEQQARIVAELDCLTGIIEKKKQQLEELDKLAQSIFYEMFGDPITNEKGWKVKKLGDLCEVITKGTTPSSLGFSFVEEGINFLKVESFNSDETLNEAKIFHITKECDAALRRSRLEANDILMCIAGATCGRLAIVPSSVIPANTNQAFGIIRLKDKEQSFHRYIYSFLHSSFIRESVNDLMKGVAQPNLTLAHLRGFSILLPPTALQNEFAQKIEGIEKQKELVKRSIVETETLFNSRMDFWFN